LVANPPDDNQKIAQTLERLASAEPQEPWSQFLEDFSPLILRVIQAFEREPDSAGDCFLFVCEKLSQDQFRRLRRFKPEGSARFSTWLQVVVRNLCRDWHRKEFGRLQIFQTIARLAPLDQEVFRSVYHQNLTKEDCYFRLLERHPGLTLSLFEESLIRIQRALTPRQLWLLQARRPRVGSLENATDDDEQGTSSPRIADPNPDPEALSAMKEQQAALERALGRLEASERLLLELRFDQGMTLRGIARLMDLKDAQTADRRIRDILEKLRRMLNLTYGARGKTGAPSV
jgi:RNA polymerase sigma factor (sigma-70 family)